MSVEIALLLAILAFLVLIALEVPLGIAIGSGGLLGLVLLGVPDIADKIAGTFPYNTTAKYALFVIPMYVLLGALISNAGIGAKIYAAINRLVYRLPGGLGATAVLATAVFSGISGSSAADIATFGRISVTEMERNGYAKAYGAAVVAAAGTFAVLIPPSVVLVLYAVIAEQSIGAMILAGVVPGIISAVILAAWVVLRAAVGNRRGAPALAAAGAGGQVAALTAPPVAPDPPVAGLPGDAPATTTPGGEPPTGRPEGMRRPAGLLPGVVPRSGDGRQRNYVGLVYAAILFAIVAGGLYAGVFTATEAGAVGAFAALVIAILARRSADMPLRQVILGAIRETSTVTSMIFLLLIGGSIFTFLLVYGGLTTQLATWTTGLGVPPLALVGIFLLLLIPIGMFLDGMSVLLIIVPIAAPVVTALGFDGVWFGILVLKMIEIGLITPPVGINVFIICGIVNLPVESVFRKVAPFVALDIAVTGLFFAFPEIVLWLPRTAGLI